MSLQKAVFLFIKLGLKISEPRDQDVTFMASISDSNWKKIYDVSINQGISAIMLDGINRIFEKGGRNAINNQIPFFLVAALYIRMDRRFFKYRGKK